MVLWASWAGSFLVGAVLCIVECLFSGIAGLYPLDAGSNTHTHKHTHTTPAVSRYWQTSPGSTTP